LTRSIKHNHEPVNVVLSRTVKPGHEKDYEELAHKAIKASRRYTGHEGATVIKEGDRRYHLVYRFKNHDKLNDWLNSPERQQIRDKIAPITEDNEDIQKLTGLETWFTVPGQNPLKSPPRSKMWLATLIGAYPLVVLFQAFITPHIEKWPLLLRSAAFPLLLLSLMTFVVMPQVSKLLKPWLYKGVDSQTKDKN
jgi:antibiotic biosynthesis monooxygenase (ABM) superfamily enzyme